MRRAARQLVVAACFVASLAALGACRSGPEPLSVSVSPHETRIDDPFHLRVSGARPGALTIVTVESTDNTGALWRSSASFHADAQGRVDADTDPSQGGSYTGVAGTALVWSMLPAKTTKTAAYRWDKAGPSTFRVTATSNGSTASTTFRRGAVTTSLTGRSPALQPDGFVGLYLSGPVHARRGPAVLVIGGSEGGLGGTLEAAMFAEHGYPALAVAYFDEPGLPTSLSNIPLEYFEHALTWLSGQPGVDPAKIVVVGGSRGSEAALLLGVHDPAQVHGVIAASPNDAALCSYPACSGPAWTLDGKALPYTREFDQPHPTDAPDAVIPAAQIRGPVLEVCGERDSLWTSCAYARATMAALDADPASPPHELIAVPAAGHMIDGLFPGEPGVSEDLSQVEQANDQEALPDVWRRVLAFLASLR